MGEFQALIQLIGVPAAVFVLAALLGERGRWVFGRYYDAVVLENKELKADLRQ